MSLPETRASAFPSFRSRWLIVAIIAGLAASIFAVDVLGDSGQYLFYVVLVAWGAWSAHPLDAEG